MNFLKLFYWFVILALGFYLLSVFEPQSEQWRSGGVIGFSLGIVGTILILLSFLYTVFKRVFKSQKFLGNLDIHIFTGALGLTLIIFHSGFSYRGIAGFAFVSCVLVIVSGIIGDAVSEKYKTFLHYWDYLHIANTVLFLSTVILHIVGALLFHRGFQ